MASFSVPCPKCPSPSISGLKTKNSKSDKQNFSLQNGLRLKPCQSLGSSIVAGQASSGFQCLNQKQFPVWKIQAQLNQATTAEKSKNSAPGLVAGSGVASSNENVKPSAPTTSADASSTSTFMNQVADLVKLVDSRDIVELQLKQSEFELMIRKKEAMQPPPDAVAAPIPQSVPYPVFTSLPQPPPITASASAPAPASSPPSKPVLALPSPAKASTSSHPPLKCPMAGTFYRSPAPGEPPFVKVGDKVQKGQVVCIVEAMKLMNEIEADQSGTITEILVEDGKQVSIDMPLLVIVL